MPANRSTFIAGSSLILLGLIFLVTTLVRDAWPVLLIGLGIVLLFSAVAWRAAGLATSGTVNLALGSILLYQTVSSDWKSWYYLWPLLFSAVGLGMLLTRLLDPRNDAWRGKRYLIISWTWLALGVAAAAALFAFRAALDWPSILWAMGAMFLLAALISGVGPLAIPGVFLGGLGLILNLQLLTGDWRSWAYVWALLPGLVGLGLFLAFLRRRVPRIVGLSMMGWSLVVFVIFGVFFAGDGGLARYWPVALILGGLFVLVQGLLVRPQPKAQ